MGWLGRRTRGLHGIPVTVLALWLVAACGEVTAHTSSPPVTRATSTPSASASTSTAPCPQQDTPFDQAPAAMQKAWSGAALTFGVSHIPSCAVLADTGIPISSIKFTNSSGLPDAQAQAMYRAWLHEQNLFNDAKAHADAGMMRDLAAPFIDPNDYDAALKGTSTVEGSCAFPKAVTLLPVSAADMTATTAGVDTASGYGFWSLDVGPCAATLTTAAGQTSVDTYGQPGTIHVGPLFGVVADRGPLGTIFSADGSVNCTNPTPADLGATCAQIGSQHGG